MDARAALVNRQLPEMVLSDGSVSSKTAPPPAIPVSNNAQIERFGVQGPAVLTGGSGTLALTCARALLEHGVSNLVLWDLGFEQAGVEIERLADSFPHVKIHQVVVDVTSGTGVNRAIRQTVEAVGIIRILCCFAGVVGCEHALQMQEQDWRKTLDVNLTGSFLCAQAVGRQMKGRADGGSIVLIASISGQAVNYPQPQAAYNASKAGVVQLTKCLAAELAVDGIRVNCISPGYMDTILNDGPGLQHARDTWCARNPMGRMGQPHELQGPLVMLCSRAGSYINGANIVVDGGQTCF